jgi:hypothetical protein
MSVINTGKTSEEEILKAIMNEVDASVDMKNSNKKLSLDTLKDMVSLAPLTPADQSRIFLCIEEYAQIVSDIDSCFATGHESELAFMKRHEVRSVIAFGLLGHDSQARLMEAVMKQVSVATNAMVAVDCAIDPRGAMEAAYAEKDRLVDMLIGLTICNLNYCSTKNT